MSLGSDMTLTLLFFLLPVAALTGWWLGRAGADKGGGRKPPGYSAQYFRGLNFLLNEQPDKAIDVFVKMLEVDSETVETHLALGNLFRRRGEVDRAIRIHQNLIARPSLSKAQRALSLYELGQDYLKAGLLNRAESLFLELVEQSEYRVEALDKLLDIYQQEKEWEKAINVARRINTFSGRDMGQLIAQFLCEQGDLALANRELKSAARLAKRALGFDKTCVRASILQADIERADGNYKAAIKSLKQVEEQDAKFVPEVIERLMKCYHETGRLDEAERYLEFLLHKHSGITTLLALVDILRQRVGDRAAAERIVAFMRERPSVRGLDRLIELNLANSGAAEREHLHVLKELTRKLLEEKNAYLCSHCGFKGKVLRWQCPSCRHWRSITPVYGVVGE